ncbi:MAG: hypothetical protein M1828_003923 [Chrysothrix sp. TS-e1954]|nr:MAG: hypothetical protein M1828_003923 [Chrysothrix sp. TS-e1954]
MIALRHASDLAHWLFKTGQPLLGFFFVIAIWSIFVGDWKPAPAPPPLAQSSSSADSEPVWRDWASIKEVFFLGDSYTSYFFNVFGDQPSETNPLGNFDRWDQAQAGFAASGSSSLVAEVMPPQFSEVWAKLLTMKYNESGLLAYNLAMSGSVIEWRMTDKDRGKQQPSFPSSLKQQVDTFELHYVNSMGPLRASFSAETSLFALWSGINDIQLAYAGSYEVAWESMFASYTVSVERLYHMGARNFLILNTPPFDRIHDFDGKYRANIPIMNERIEYMVHKLRKRYSDMKLFYFNSHWLFTDILDDAHQFPMTADLKTVTDSCKPYQL